jgi:hypothetical protein
MLVAVIALTLAAATPDAPTPIAPAEVKSQKKKDADDPDKIVCKSQPIPGSRMTGRVCATRRQWDENQTASNQLFKDAQERAGVGNTGPPMGMRAP